MSDNDFLDLSFGDAPAAAEAVPELSLDLEESSPTAPEPAKPEVKPVELDDSMLSDADRKSVV